MNLKLKQPGNLLDFFKLNKQMVLFFFVFVFYSEAYTTLWCLNSIHVRCKNRAANILLNFSNRVQLKKERHLGLEQHEDE